MPDKVTPNHDPVRDEPKPDESRRDWEDVQTNTHDVTERLKIHDGWLYRTRTTSTSTTAAAVALVFVPNARG